MRARDKVLLQPSSHELPGLDRQACILQTRSLTVSSSDRGKSRQKNCSDRICTSLSAASERNDQKDRGHSRHKYDHHRRYTSSLRAEIIPPSATDGQKRVLHGTAKPALFRTTLEQPLELWNRSAGPFAQVTKTGNSLLNHPVVIIALARSNGPDERFGDLFGR